MDDDLREAERRARASDDAASWLVWAAALRRAGRDMEGAAAAFEARARGASRDEVFPLGQPREGGGDALSPWPHPRGDSAATRRSRVEGPTERAKLLFEIDLGQEPVSWGGGPIVLPDGSVVVKLDLASRESELRCFAPDGAPRWSHRVRESASPPVGLASGEIVYGTPRELVFLGACRGEIVSRTLLVPTAALAAGLIEAWRVPAAWNRSVLVGERFVASDGSVSALRGEGERRLFARSAAASPERCYLVGATYGVGPPAGSAPPLLFDPMALHTFGREGELRWRADLDPMTPKTGVAAGRGRVFAIGAGSLRIIDASTGSTIETRPHSGDYLALDPADEPIPLAPFGAPLIAAPLVDAAGRRYAVVQRGDLVGLAPGGGVLFNEPLSLTGETLAGIALGRGRLYLLVLRSTRPAIVCFGDG